MSLSDTQIDILILLGCGDKTRTQKQVCEIFNTKYPDRLISQSTVSRIENKFREFANVTDIPKSDNPHKPTRQIAVDNDVTTFVLNGTVNKQNCRYWSTENPHWMMEANTGAQLRMLFPDDDNPNEMDR
ncbi:hypothetical protein NQ318_009260, partial [Aromia moschata]